MLFMKNPLEPVLKSALTHSLPIWEQCKETPFVRKLLDGTLPEAAFRTYVIQDSIYLRHYAQAYGKAIYHAQSLAEIQLYYSALGFVSREGSEMALRLGYLTRLGFTSGEIEEIQPLPENQRYIRFLQETAERGDRREILMAILPCMLSYGYIFQGQTGRVPAPGRLDYRELIREYASEDYGESCREWLVFAGNACKGLPEWEQAALTDIFVRGSLLELGFWRMFGEGRDGE